MTTLIVFPLLLGPSPAQHVERHVKQVTLERTRCFGTCPAYKVTIRDDGTVLYHGEAFVARIGDYRAKLWPYALENFNTTLNKLGFWSLQSKYSVNVTDQSSQTVTVVSDHGAKKVYEYGHHGPNELWAVQTLIDGLIADARNWEKVGKQRVKSRSPR